MTIRITLAAIALTFVPVMTMALGCSARGNHAQSCAAGTAWDSTQQTCVKLTSG